MAKKYSRNVQRIYPGMSLEDTKERVKRDGAQGSKSVVDFAEDLGQLLGTAQAKASTWLTQRQDVIDELTQLRDTANQLLHDLTGGVAKGREALTRGPRRGSRADGVATPADAGSRRRRRRTMTAAQRKAVSQRMRKYWAARRKTKTAEA